MEKLTGLFSILFYTFLLVSCSTDNEPNNIAPSPDVKPLTEYPVDVTLSNKEIDSYPQNDYKRRIFILNKSNNTKHGNLGIIYFCIGSYYPLHLAYDLCCPIHWEDSDPLKHTLDIEEPDEFGFTHAVCNIKGYKSKFNLEFGGESLNSYAGKNNIKLVEYTVNQYPKLGYPDFPKAEGRLITNANYKKK